MTIGDAIIGEWSDYLYNGYGTMEETSLAFRHDGTGWYAFDNGDLCERVMFTWTLSGENRVTIIGTHYAAASDNGWGFTEKPCVSQWIDIAVCIQEEPTRWPGETSILTTVTFTPALFPWTPTFARTGADIHTLLIPQFPAEKYTN